MKINENAITKNNHYGLIICEHISLSGVPLKRHSRGIGLITRKINISITEELTAVVEIRYATGADNLSGTDNYMTFYIVFRIKSGSEIKLFQNH